MMSESISPIFEWLNAHPNMAGLATFLISAAESIAIVGTIIPGSVTMTAIGTLAGAGVIPLWSTLVWGIFGAIVGDNFSYGLGYYFKGRLAKMWPFSRHPQILLSGEKFFHKYGILSVFIGRFIGPVRAIVPVVAGMLGMKPTRYIPVSIAASIAWAPAYMMPGILIGAATLELPPDVAVHVILTLLFILLFAILCIWVVFKIFALIHDQVNQFLNRTWHGLQESRHFHIVTSVLKHHDHTKTHGQLTLAFYFILTSCVFLYLAAYIAFHASQNILINKVVFFIFRSWRAPSAEDAMLFLTMLGDKHVLVPVAVILFVWFAATKRWYTAWHALALLFMTAGSIVCFKHLVHSPRPWGIMNGPETFSFPSGHTTLSTTLYFGMGLVLIHAGKFRHKFTLYFLTALIVACISLSRLYLGAHWFTDILGGWLLGAALLMLICLSYNRGQDKHIPAGKTLLIFLIALLTLTSFEYHENYDRLQKMYTRVEWASATVPLESWWLQKSPALPLNRIGRVGLPAEVFNLQWLGNLDDIKTQLVKQGWEIPPERNWISTLHRIGDVSSAEHLPLVQPRYLDKTPALALIKHVNGDKKIIVLHLWKANINIEGSNQSLWVGSVGLVPRTYSWLFNYKNTHLKLNPNLLFKNPPAEYDIKLIYVHVEFKRKHQWIRQPMILIKPKNS